MASRHCVVCATRLHDSAIQLEQVPGLQQKVEKHPGRRSDSVSPQDSICVPCWKQIEGPLPQEKPTGSSIGKKVLKFGLPILGAAAAVAAAPVAVAALGFGAGGIVAGSVAASMMSASATTGVGAGVVAVLQSVGAVGFSLAGNAVLAGAGATVGGLLSKFGRRSKKGNDPDERSSGDGPNGSGKPPADGNRKTPPEDSNPKRPPGDGNPNTPPGDGQ